VHPVSDTPTARKRAQRPGAGIRKILDEFSDDSKRWCALRLTSAQRGGC
jgi:hypothetical protein